MTKLIRGPIWTKVDEMNPVILRLIDETLSARPKGFQFAPSFKNHFWDGWIHLFKNNKFPAGLTNRVVEVLSENNIQGSVVNKMRKINITEPEPTLGMLTLREYQMKAVQLALEHKRGILHLATNAGKTLVTASIINCTGNSAIVVVPTKALLIQTLQEYTKMLGHITTIGAYGAGRHDIQPVTVSTIASLDKLIKNHPDIKSVNTLIFDECHHSKAKTVLEKSAKIPAPIRIGCSGTPLMYNKLNDMQIIGVTGPVLMKVTNKDLIKDGFSTPPTIRFIEIDNMECEEDYPTCYNKCIVSNEYRNNVIADTAIIEMKNGPVLILVDRILHAHKLGGLIPDSVVATAATKDTMAVLNGLKDGNIKCAVVTPIFGEGVDVPSISSIIMAAGGKSHIKQLQRIGRALRKTEGQDKVFIYDFIDDTNSYMFDHSMKRHETYLAEGFEIELYDV